MAAPSAFRLAERKYKFYKKPPHDADYSDVVDFSHIQDNNESMKEAISCKEVHLGDRTLQICSLRGVDGFLFIPQALTIEEQAHWAHRSISEYPQPPNFSNFGGMLADNVWSSHLESDESITDPKARINKLRWVTLAYHYNWSTNIYENTPERISEFPPELVELCNKHATISGIESYEPQAGIVNFYHGNVSMMKAHQDESEFTFDKPIFSYSMGARCIFLLGRASTDIEPIPIWMNSGDLMIMGGHSRVFYHGAMSNLLLYYVNCS